MIIPQIAENLTRSGVRDIPETCPACGGATRIQMMNNVETLYCTNPECPAKKIKAFTLFTSRDAMNIDGLSEATLEKFIAMGFIHNFGDIFEIGRYNLNNKKCLATLAETLVASSLYKLKLLRHNFIGLFYDPKKSGVDFLVRNIDKIIPIEVGVGKKTKSQLTKAINNYNSDYGILISNRTFSIKKENNIIYIPLRTFSYI